MISVPIVAHDRRNQSYVKTPEWMVAIGDMMSSSIEGFEGLCELFGWQAGLSRFTTGNISTNLHSSATVAYSDLVMVVPMGESYPKLKNSLAIGKKIDKITILRLGNINGVKLIIQEIVFEICRLQYVLQNLDQVVVCSQIQRCTDTVEKFDNNGEKKGHVVSCINIADGMHGLEDN